MNDRELYCRGKASEARSQARVSRDGRAKKAHLDTAKSWEEEGDQEAHNFAAALARTDDKEIRAS